MSDLKEDIKQMYAKGVQVLAVGDPNQSIFEWRGGADLLDHLGEIFGKQLALSTTYRSGEVTLTPGNVILFLSGENVRTVSGKPEMEGMIYVSEKSEFDVNEVPDFLKGKIETRPEKFIETLEGLSATDAIITTENAPILKHLIFAAANGLTVAVAEKYRNEVIQTLDAFDIVRFPASSAARREARGSVGFCFSWRYWTKNSSPN
jgi:hypothetical protein